MNNEEQLEDAGNILLLGVALICGAVAFAFGIVWALLLGGAFCILVAVVKASAR